MPRRVLIADDSAVARLALVRKVQAAGLEVVEYDSCASAAAVQADGLACAVLDYDLGDGFGVEIAARLRTLRPTLPIAFFTSTREDTVSAHAAPFGPVFTKPDELESAVAWALRAAGVRH